MNQPVQPAGAAESIGASEPLAPLETEVRLRGSRRAFRALAAVTAIDGWHVVARRRSRLRDVYWDTPDHRLAAQGITLRVREVVRDPASRPAAEREAGPSAELTLKRPAERPVLSAASHQRYELTVPVPPGAGPREWQRLPAARPVAAALRALGALDDLRPDLVLSNPRRELVLRRGARRGGQGEEVVLSLDEVTIEGMPYRRRYVELELVRGARATLEELAARVQKHFGVRASRTGKVQAARRWMARQGSDARLPRPEAIAQTGVSEKRDRTTVEEDEWRNGSR